MEKVEAIEVLDCTSVLQTSPHTLLTSCPSLTTSPPSFRRQSSGAAPVPRNPRKSEAPFLSSWLIQLRSNRYYPATFSHAPLELRPIRMKKSFKKSSTRDQVLESRRGNTLGAQAKMYTWSPYSSSMFYSEPAGEQSDVCGLLSNVTLCPQAKTVQSKHRRN